MIFSKHYVQSKISFEKVKIKPNNDNDDNYAKPQIRFSLDPSSNHITEGWQTKPARTASEDAEETYIYDDTVLVGPTVVVSMEDFIANSEEFLTGGYTNDEYRCDDIDIVRRRACVRDLRGHFSHHGAIEAVVLGLEVDLFTMMQLLDIVIVTTDLWMAGAADHLRGFHIDVTLRLRAYTARYEIVETLINDDDDADDVVAGYDDINWMVPAATEAVNRLEIEMFDDVAEVNEDDHQGQCVICYDDFEGESLVTRLECSHVFHCDCLFEWLDKSHYCPLCRFELPV